jgi:hypothetical protein
MRDFLITKEGIKIGYGPGSHRTPLEHLQRSDPRNLIVPKGFLEMLFKHCGEAYKGIQVHGKIYGFRLRDIIEGN